jgi:DNA-binding phage protein
MKLKHKIIALTMIPAFVGIGFLGVNAASAHGLFGSFGSTLTPDEIAGRQQTMFQKEADLLGVSVDDVKAAWAAGKSLAELASEKGITKEQLQQKLKDARLAEFKTQLQTLVDKGVITQAQADQRLQYIQNQQEKMNGKIGGGRHGMKMGMF